MALPNKIEALFLDVGGVLLNNGWDHGMRRRAAEHFRFNYDEMESRHGLVFGVYEEGKVALDDYLDRVVFYHERAFTRDEFKEYMFAQSEAHEDMLALVRSIKETHPVKVVAVSNEARELNAHRIATFQLADVVDFFISSCFVGLRKPDVAIFRVALDAAQVSPECVAYVEDRPLFVEIASDLGIHAIRHRGYGSTRAALEELGLAVESRDAA